MFDAMITVLRTVYHQTQKPMEDRVPRARVLIELLDAVNHISMYMKDELNQGSHPNYAREKLLAAKQRLDWAYKEVLHVTDSTS
jgi:hypothetical protein